MYFCRSNESAESSISGSRTSLSITAEESPRYPTSSFRNRRRASTYNETYLARADSPSPTTPRKRSFSFHEQVTETSSSKRQTDTPLIDESRNKESQTEDDEEDDQAKKSPSAELSLPPPCTCPYFGESSKGTGEENRGPVVRYDPQTLDRTSRADKSDGSLRPWSLGEVEDKGLLSVS